MPCRAKSSHIFWVALYYTTEILQALKWSLPIVNTHDNDKSITFTHAHVHHTHAPMSGSGCLGPPSQLVLSIADIWNHPSQDRSQRSAA